MFCRRLFYEYVENKNILKHLTRQFFCIADINAVLMLHYCVGNGSGGTSVLSRPMQRKLVTLINCQLMEEEGRSRAMRAARSLGERTVTELILQHQNPQQLSANLWAAVRARGCQFLGPGTVTVILMSWVNFIPWTYFTLKLQAIGTVLGLAWESIVCILKIQRRVLCLTEPRCFAAVSNLLAPPFCALIPFFVALF